MESQQVGVISSGRMSGSGRGRGWLKLNNKNDTNHLKVQQLPNNVSPNSPNISSSDSALFSDLSVCNEYSELIAKVKQLDLADDGILFNQKIRYITDSWKELCHSGEEVEQSFKTLHDACLQDTDLASKLVYLISSRTFISQEINDQNIRLLFLRELQNDFESCKQLQNRNPLHFRNCVKMLGEFYNKARLANGQQFTFMAVPFITYLEMLLVSNQTEDLTLFSSQLYLNGVSLKAEEPEKMNNLIGKVRLILASEQSLQKQSKLWLLLSLEIASNRFGQIPIDVLKFYQEQLGDAAMSNFQGSHGTTLSVQTSHASKTLEEFQSNVNVLQVSTSDPSEISSSNSEYNNYNTGYTITEGSHNNVQFNKDRYLNKNKAGRPILGSGASAGKNKPQEFAGNWRNHPQNSWSNNKKDWGERSTKSKGWEHDDRFETDYS